MEMTPKTYEPNRGQYRCFLVTGAVDLNTGRPRKPHKVLMLVTKETPQFLVGIPCRRILDKMAPTDGTFEIEEKGTLETGYVTILEKAAVGREIPLEFSRFYGLYRESK